MTFGDDFRRLADQHRDTCRDLERERVAGRHTQEQAELLGKKLRELEESVKRSSFVLVLIDADADAYLFDDGYFDDPVDGGKRAALALGSAVRKWWKAENPSLGDIPVVVKAFANGDGLAQLLMRAGMVKRDNALASFASSFSQADEMFDFVLVGKGKDRADHKITGALKHYVESPSCRHILFAACHDNGYVRTLEKYDREPSAAKKITLLRSFQTGREFSSLGLPSITFESVFRKLPLPQGDLVISGKADDSVRASSSVNSKTPSSTNGITQALQGPSSYAQQVASSPSNEARPLPRFVGNPGCNYGEEIDGEDRLGELKTKQGVTFIMAVGQKRKRPASDPVPTVTKPASKLTKTITHTVIADSHLKGEEGTGKTEDAVEQQQLLDLIASSSMTPFEKRVLSLLCQIPRGRVSTYGLLSARLGSSPRAVGGALRRNPFAPRVPCHRVVAAGGGLGGFKGAWPRDGVGITLDEKRRLLRGEGVRFDAKGRVLGTPWGEFV
ncbi:hypothetical protein DL767_000476 [Monosporascus sp. MG133]|nr:hypothetical protein DL767_000476 [Monosporascus sp. MG133]